MKKPICKIRDDELARLYRQTGDPQYLIFLYHRHYNDLCGALFLHFTGQTYVDYKAIVTEVFEFLHDFLMGTQPIINIKGWLYTRTKTHFAGALRDASRQKRDYRREYTIEVNRDSYGEVNMAETTQPTGLDHVIQEEEAQLVRQAVATLSAKEQQIVACKMQGLTDVETARDLQIPIGTVKSAYSHARELLRVRLQGKICPCESST